MTKSTIKDTHNEVKTPSSSTKTSCPEIHSFLTRFTFFFPPNKNDSWVKTKFKKNNNSNRIVAKDFISNCRSCLSCGLLY